MCSGYTTANYCYCHFFHSLTSSVLGHSKFQPQIWSLPVNMFMDIIQMVRVTVPTITSQGWEATRRPCIRNRRVSMVQQSYQRTQAKCSKLGGADCPQWHQKRKAEAFTKWSHETWLQWNFLHKNTQRISYLNAGPETFCVCQHHTLFDFIFLFLTFFCLLFNLILLFFRFRCKPPFCDAVIHVFCFFHTYGENSHFHFETEWKSNFTFSLGLTAMKM